MKKLVLGLLLGSITLGVQIDATKEKKKDCASNFVTCCDPTILTSNDLTAGIITITAPGVYALGEDIDGRITINSSDVCLDLHGHKLTVSNNYAILNGSTATSNIIIKGGIISSAGNTGGGIFLTDIIGVTLFDLDFRNVQQAIRLENCKNGNIKNIDANNNTLSIGYNMIDIHGTPVGISHTFDICNVSISHSTIIASFRTTSGLFDINQVDNVTIKNCHFNNNTFIPASTVSTAATFATVHIDTCKNLVFTNSEVNNNQSTGLNSELINTAFANITNCSIAKSEFNNTTVDHTTLHAVGLKVGSSIDLTIDCCEANGTTINTATGEVGIEGFAVGIYLSGIDGICMSHTEANHTTHRAVEGSSDSLGGPKGILFDDINHRQAAGSRKSFVKDCKANHTRIIDVSASESEDNVFGIFISDSKNLTFCNTQASYNKSAGNGAYGIFIGASSNLIFEHDQANHNEAQVSVAGFYLGLALQDPTTNILVNECCAIANSATAQDGIAYGFVSEALQDSIIKESLAKENTTAGFFYGKFTAEGSSNKNIQTIRNCAEENGNGFVVKDNFENLLFFENKAIDNTLCGFSGNANPIWIGNLAQGNGTDFCVTPAVEVDFKKKGNLCCKDDGKSEKRDTANVSYCEHHPKY